MHPFFYPTTTVIIDDDQTFLDSLNYNLSDDMLCRSFNSSESALEHIKAREKDTVNIEHFFSAHQNNHDFDVNDQGDLFLKVHSTYWFHLLQSPERFDEISVAVIDYSMPSTNGIELCRQLKDHPMKKIMLTGQADEEIAVAAFNEKIIDSFILKKGTDDISNLREEIEKHKLEYFCDKTQSFKLAFSLQESRFITDPAFLELFEAHKKLEGIEEYYANTQPPGILMFNAEGRPSLMMVYDTERMRAHFEIAAETGAPQPMLASLANHDYLALFPTDTGYYHPLHARDWQKHVYPAQKIESKQPLFIAKLNNADFILKHLNRYLPLSQHKKLSRTFIKF